MKGIILCGGRGTRLRPYTYSRPKPLLPVGNKPVIEHSIAKLCQFGIREIGIVVSPYHVSQFEEILGFECQGAKLSYIEQLEPMGLANAVRTAQAFIQNDQFCVILGDNYYSGDLTAIMDRFRMEGQDAVVLVNHVPNPENFGVAQLEGSRVVKLVEKPQTPISSYALVGIYLFTTKIFEVISDLEPSARGEYELTDAIQALIDQGSNVSAVITNEWWRDTGSPRDLLMCNRYLLSQVRSRNQDYRTAVLNSLIDGPLILGEGAQIIDSIVRGPAVIGDGCRIVRSYVGPFTSVGNGVQIEDSEIENSIVLEQASIRQVPNRIDESIIGGNAIVHGTMDHPQTVELHLGDHSQLHMPFNPTH